MSITSANVTSFVRSLVGEATAKYWSSDEVTLYVQFAMAKVLGEFLPMLFERNKNYAYLVTTSGTSEYDAPTDTYKISQIQVTETGKKLRYISEDEWNRYKYSDAGITITDTDYFTVWYMKNLDEVTDFPDCLRPVIGIEAAIMAMTKNEDVTPAILNMLREFKLAATIDLTLTNAHQIEAFGDFEEQDSIDDAYVWTWKGGKIKFASIG